MYTAVPTDEEDQRSSTSSQDKSMEELRSSDISWKQNLSRLNRITLLLNVALFIGSFICLAKGGFLQSQALAHLEGARQQNRHFEEHCDERTSAYSPAFEAIKYKTVEFKGTFDRKSIYKGTPRPELDKAWDALIHGGNFAIDEDTMHRINKSQNLEYAARFPQESGGGIVAGLEMFHQMHCVNFLRQYTYKEYYEKEIRAFTDGPALLRLHLVVMCYADTTILTGQWVEGYPRLSADFNTEHRCRDYDALLEWNVRHADRDESYSHVKKPEGAKQRPKPAWVDLSD